MLWLTGARKIKQMQSKTLQNPLNSCLSILNTQEMFPSVLKKFLKHAENLIKFPSGSLLILFFPKRKKHSADKNKIFSSDYLFMKLSNTSLASRERRKRNIPTKTEYFMKIETFYAFFNIKKWKNYETYVWLGMKHKLSTSELKIKNSHSIKQLAKIERKRISPSKYRLSFYTRFEFHSIFHNVLPVTHRKKLCERKLETTRKKNI